MRWSLGSVKGLSQGPGGVLRGLTRWSRGDVTAVPAKVRNALMAKSGVEAPELSAWRFVSQSGVFAGRRVRFFRVFDPGRLAGDPGLVRSYGALKAFPYAIMFEGYLEADGFVQVEDLRRRSTGSDRSSQSKVH